MTNNAFQYFVTSTCLFVELLLWNYIDYFPQKSNELLQAMQLKVAEIQGAAIRPLVLNQEDVGRPGKREGHPRAAVPKIVQEEHREVQ